MKLKVRLQVEFIYRLCEFLDRANEVSAGNNEVYLEEAFEIAFLWGFYWY